MHFAHDTAVSLRGTAALVNTAQGAFPDRDGDSLATTEQLLAFVRGWSWTGRVVGDEAELAEVRALRPRLRGLWLAQDDATCVALVNALLRDGGALPQVVEHDGFGWHIHATEPDAPLAVRMQVEAAMAVVDVVRAGERGRLTLCAADDCDDVVVDLSRNRSKRYCDSGCGNRLAAAAYRSRQSPT